LTYLIHSIAFLLIMIILGYSFLHFEEGRGMNHVLRDEIVKILYKFELYEYAKPLLEQVEPCIDRELTKQRLDVIFKECEKCLYTPPPRYLE
jgi:hypothetical protein